MATMAPIVPRLESGEPHCRGFRFGARGARRFRAACRYIIVPIYVSAPVRTTAQVHVLGCDQGSGSP